VLVDHRAVTIDLVEYSCAFLPTNTSLLLGRELEEFVRPDLHRVHSSAISSSETSRAFAIR
jgi:hypothetical protein